MAMSLFNTGRGASASAMDGDQADTLAPIPPGLLEGLSGGVQCMVDALAHVSRDLRSRLLAAINSSDVDRVAIVEKLLPLAAGALLVLSLQKFVLEAYF
jgi:hypothetical protein